MPPEGGAARAGSILAQEPILLLGVVVATLYFGRPILAPLALALTLSFLLAPAVRSLQRVRVPRVLATMLVVSASTALLTGVLWLVATQLLSVVNGLTSYSGNIHAKLQLTHMSTGSPLGRAMESLEGIAQEFGDGNTPQPPSIADRHGLSRRAAALAAQTGRPPQPVVVVPPKVSEASQLRELLTPVVKPLASAGMVMVFAIYMLLKREDLRNRLLLLAGSSRLNVMTQALDEAAERISRFLIANVAVNACCGLVFGAALFLLGLPHAALWGSLLGLLRLVPYVGPVAGGMLPTVYALIAFPGWWQAASVLLIIASLEAVVSNFAEPWIYGAKTGVSALALVVMAIVWTLLWGWAGLALSTPLTVCLVVTARVLPQMSFLHVLLGDEAELAPEARFYERLLAMDQSEAHTIADRFLEQRSTLELYEEVVLPALAMAEQDRHKGLLVGERAHFLLQSAQELITELTDHKGVLSPPVLAGEDPILPLPGAPRRCPVVCIPASDQADEIAASMVAQLLEQRGHKTILLPPSALSGELLALFADDPTTTLLVSAVPPLAFVPARSLCARMGEVLPGNRIVVGLWGSSRSRDMLCERFGLEGRGAVVSNLREALEQFREEPLPTPAYARAGASGSATAAAQGFR